MTKRLKGKTWFLICLIWNAGTEVEEKKNHAIFSSSSLRFRSFPHLCFYNDLFAFASVSLSAINLGLTQKALGLMSWLSPKVTAQLIPVPSQGTQFKSWNNKRRMMYIQLTLAFRKITITTLALRPLHKCHYPEKLMVSSSLRLADEERGHCFIFNVTVPKAPITQPKYEHRLASFFSTSNSYVWDSTWGFSCLKRQCFIFSQL